VIEAVRDEDIALIVTVGRHNDPASLGPQPDHVFVHRYIPQGVLLPRCDGVITHGGSGTTLGAPTGRVVRPGRFAVHLAGVEDHDCWRCGDNRPSDPTSS
jgi:hypothetical protein